MTREIYTVSSPFEFESGVTINSLEICYHHTANYSPGKKVIWICHALTANSNPSEWWSGLVGSGKIFDTDKYYIICANIIGSCYGSTGPLSEDESGKPYLLNFPAVTVRDNVKAHNYLREYLKIETIDLIIGGSIGGFQALEWAIMYPHVVKNLVMIGSNAEISPWGTAFNESQRMALEADHTFILQRDKNGGASGLKAARAVALLSYRSYQGYSVSQKEQDSNYMFATKAVSYQNHQGKKLCDRFDAYSYYTLTKTLDSHNVARGRGSVEEALDKIIAFSLVIGIDNDILFPVEEQIFLSKNIKGARFALVQSPYGHDGFLLEWEQIEKILRYNLNFLNN